MHGKTTFKKTMRAAKRTTGTPYSRSHPYMEIGSWRFEENEDGDLVVWNLETDQKVILFIKE